jgi:hypothetical protein
LPRQHRGHEGGMGEATMVLIGLAFLAAAVVLGLVQA